MEKRTYRDLGTTSGVYNDGIRVSFPREWRALIVDAAKFDAVDMTTWCRRVLREGLNAHLKRTGDKRRAEVQKG